MSDKKEQNRESDVSKFIQKNASLIHDLRTPLLTIKACAEQLKKLGIEAQDLSSMIDTQVDRINRNLYEYWSNIEETHAGEFQEADLSLIEDKGQEYSRFTIARGLKVLVVDDDELHLDIIRRLLIQDGHEVCITQNCDQALSLLLTVKPDLLIIDIHLPDIDGVTFVNQHWATIPENERPHVVGISNDPRRENMKQLCKGAGMNSYIEKPITMEKLAKILPK